MLSGIMKVHKIICKFDFYIYERPFIFLYMEMEYEPIIFPFFFSSWGAASCIGA